MTAQITAPAPWPDPALALTTTWMTHLLDHPIAKHAARTLLCGSVVGTGRIINPAAGHGQYARAMRMLAPDADVTAMTSDHDDLQALRGFDVGTVMPVSYLRYERSAYRNRYEGIIMQPPVTVPGDDAAWATYVEAGLRQMATGGRLVAVVPEQVVTGRGERFAAIRAAATECAPLPSWAVASSGMAGEWHLLVVDASQGSVEM